MATLLILNGNAKGLELELQRGTNTLGRAAGNDFVLDDPTVSGRHCEILVSDFSVKVRDLGSTNGTMVRQAPVQEAELKDGETLRLGELQMRLHLEPVRIAVPELTRPEAPPRALPDGTPVCWNHPELPATVRCVQCAQTYCDDCVKELRLVGGKSRWFCPRCSGACMALKPAAPPKPKSFATRFWETIRLPFHRGPRPPAS